MKSLHIESGDIVFMTKGSDIMLEHFVLVDQITDEGDIITNRAMTIVKEGQGFQLQGFGISGNAPCLDGSDRGMLCVKLNHFDVYGKVVNKEVIDMFYSFTNSLSIGNLTEPKRSLLA